MVAAGGGGSPAFWLVRFEQAGYAVLLITAILLAVSLVCHIGRGLRLLVKR
jgi:hypothetical protein